MRAGEVSAIPWWQRSRPVPVRPYRRARSQPSGEVGPNRCGVCRSGRATRSSASSRVGRPRPTVLWTGTGPIIAAGLVHRASSPSRRSRTTGRRPRVAATSPTRSRPASGRPVRRRACAAGRARCPVSTVGEPPRRLRRRPRPGQSCDRRGRSGSSFGRLVPGSWWRTGETPGSRRSQADFAILPGCSVSVGARSGAARISRCGSRGAAIESPACLYVFVCVKHCRKRCVPVTRSR